MNHGMRLAVLGVAAVVAGTLLSARYASSTGWDWVVGAGVGTALGTTLLACATFLLAFGVRKPRLSLRDDEFAAHSRHSDPPAWAVAHLPEAPDAVWHLRLGIGLTIADQREFLPPARWTVRLLVGADEADARYYDVDVERDGDAPDPQTASTP